MRHGQSAVRVRSEYPHAHDISIGPESSAGFT